jgi:hypothetical protein
MIDGTSFHRKPFYEFSPLSRYLYYYLTSVDNKYKQSFWKKYITQIQMVRNQSNFHVSSFKLISNSLAQIQFGMMALHFLTLLVMPDCGYPKWLAFFMLPQNFFIFVLFYDFYRKTYQNLPASEKAENNNEPTPKRKHEKVNLLNYEKTIAD